MALQLIIHKYKFKQICRKQINLGWPIRVTPSLCFKKVGDYWSARITQNYRAVGILNEGTVIWFFIGTHEQYAGIIGR